MILVSHHSAAEVAFDLVSEILLPSHVSRDTDWKAYSGLPALEVDGVCGVRLFQGVLVGGRVLSFHLG